MPERKYDTTLARMAGNIAAGMVGDGHDGGYDLENGKTQEWIAETSLCIAEHIVSKLKTAAADSK